MIDPLRLLVAQASLCASLRLGPSLWRLLNHRHHGAPPLSKVSSGCSNAWKCHAAGPFMNTSLLDTGSQHQRHHPNQPHDRPCPSPAPSPISSSCTPSVSFKPSRLQPISEDQTPGSCDSSKSQTITFAANDPNQATANKIRFQDIKYMHDIDFNQNRPQVKQQVMDRITSLVLHILLRVEEPTN